MQSKDIPDELIDQLLVGHRYLSSHSLEAVLNDYRKDNPKEETRELTAA
jgi:hypothetical protein